MGEFGPVSRQRLAKASREGDHGRWIEGLLLKQGKSMARDDLANLGQSIVV